MNKPFRKISLDLKIDKNIINEIKNEVKFIQRYFVKNEGQSDEYKIREARQISLLSNNKNGFLPYSDVKLNVTGAIEGKIKMLQSMVENLLNKKFDLILVNFYSTIEDKMGWHRDGGVIDDDVVVLSLGGSRIFEFRDKETKKIQQFRLNNGEMIHMWGKCQDLYDHRVKNHKQSNPNQKFEERISIVFRQLNKYTLESFTPHKKN